jgi:Zn-dependent metalloprotease
MKRIFTLVLLTTVLQTYAQNTLRDMIRGEQGASKHFVRLSPEQQRSFNQNQLISLLDLDNRAGFELLDQQTDALGFTHYRYRQTYKGIPIENSMYIVHVKNGMITGLSGEIAVDFNDTRTYETSAALSERQGISVALKKVAAREYMWQDAHMEQRLKEQTRNPAASFAPNAALVWFNEGEGINPRNLRLAYKVDVYAKEPLSRADHFIDAQTGEYLGRKDKIYYTDAVGTATTAYSGSQTIHSDFTGSSYRLRDYTKGSGVITRHGESGSKGLDYTSSSANWALTGTSQAALDAHYGVSQTYSFYLANFNRNSYNGTGGALYSYVNISGTVDNAYWDGSAMNFGTRSTGAPGGVTGIDVTGHELTHGVTQTTSNLTYSGESGAMNESMSDIMGKSVQFWSKPGDVNWQLSNDMNWIIRDMSNPNLKQQPDTYKGTYWYTGTSDNGGVHTNSGVGNYMFYLLVNGGSGTNDLGNSFSVTGIGLAKADQILYRSETVYLTSSSKYADWRTACVNAATDLYGAGSNEVTQVMNAWYAVGIGTAGGTGNGCSAPTGLTASSITNTSATVSWSAVSGALSYNLQWKAASSGTWNTVSGLTTTSYSLTGLTLGTTYQFQVQTVCSAGSSPYSNTASFTTTGGSITYCTSKGSSTTYEWIKQVAFGGINNTSGNNNGYGNYTGLTANVTAGSSYTITLVPGFSGSAYREYWSVYIDYDQNGTLNNTGELVVTGYTSTSSGGSATITIPATAKSGKTRMRIQMHYGSQITNPCSTFDYGEVEDYTINISGGTFTVGAPADPGFAGGLQGAGIAMRPNPVAGSNATITYNLAQDGATAIRVMDLAGRTLQTVQLGNQPAGTHTYNPNNLGRLPAGNYLIVLEQNAAVIARSRFVIAR